jgi:pimeloyl-ACP methyl ester carboxylesterase
MELKVIFQDKAVLGFSIIVIAAGSLGAIIHGSLSSAETPVLANQFLGLWYSILFMVAGTELLYYLKRAEIFFINTLSFTVDMIYLGSILITSFISFICYSKIAYSGKSPTAWSVLTFFWSLYTIPYYFHRRTLAKENKPDSYSKTTSAQCIRFGAGCFKCFHWIFAIFLTAGAIVAATVTAYKAPGTIYSLQLTDGRTTHIHVYCTGPKNGSTIWLLADAAHGVVDFYGLQDYLAKNGRRVCTQDNPGFGWSDDIIAGIEKDYMLFYDAMFQAANEGSPMVLAAWGGGGSQVSSYYMKYPNKVKSIIFMDVFSPGIEFESLKYLNNWSDEKLKSYQKIDFMGRVSMGNLILGLGLPWGLMPIFVPMASVPKNFQPPEKAAEYRVQLWTNKMWVGQVASIRYMATQDYNEDPLYKVKLDSTVPFAQIACNVSRSVICVRAEDDVDCDLKIKNYNYYLDRQISMTYGISPNATVILNTDSDCALDMPVNKSSVIGQYILNLT